MRDFKLFETKSLSKKLCGYKKLEQKTLWMYGFLPSAFLGKACIKLTIVWQTHYYPSMIFLESDKFRSIGQ